MSSLDKATAAIGLIASLKQLNEKDVDVNDLLDKHYASDSLGNAWDDTVTYHLLGNKDTGKPACPVCDIPSRQFCRVYDALSSSVELLSSGKNKRTR